VVSRMPPQVASLSLPGRPGTVNAAHYAPGQGTP
jgi:hypothetical protein